MMNHVMITQGTHHDVDLIMPIMNSAFDPAFGEAWTKAQCMGMLSLPGSNLLIARTDEVPIGFALTRAIVDESELLLIAVSKDAQGRGVGQTLIDTVIKDAKICNIGKLFLEVRDNNPACSLYRKCGFSQVGTRKNYYRGVGGQLTDALTLHLIIG
jgi:[ribosomal protein S18]-alanine N-acetyltransferase